MSTSSHNSALLEGALGNVSATFKKRIIDTYLELKIRSTKSVYSLEFDASGLSAGKFCETLFRFLQFELTGGTYTSFGTHIPNLAIGLTQLEQTPRTAGNDSLRIIIPRAVLLIYTIRNKRGIGHVGGDVEANQIDASTIVKVADWIIAELCRCYHTLSLEEAQAVVDSLNTKSIPGIWEVNSKKRVLKKGLPYKEQVLLLVYSDTDNAVAVEDLFEWTEYSSLSMFKSSVLTPLHRDKLIEYDKDLDYVHLSPLGISEVEKKLLF